MPELITENFLEEVRGQPPPVVWYQSVDFIQKFSMNGYVEANICEAKDATNLSKFFVFEIHNCLQACFEAQTFMFSAQIRLTMKYIYGVANATLVVIPSCFLLS